MTPLPTNMLAMAKQLDAAALEHRAAGQLRQVNAAHAAAMALRAAADTLFRYKRIKREISKGNDLA